MKQGREMKRLGTVSILIILVILLDSLLVSCEEQPVDFSDKHVEVRIRIVLGKPQGAIYTSDLEKLTYLEVGGVNITSLSGLEYCTNLIELNLVANQISDMSPLSSLTNLNHLDLEENQISGVSPLSSLTNLTELNLVGNKISDVSPLSSLTNLTSLWLSGNQISDVSPLSSLTGLRALSLESNQISDVSPLSSLTGLRDLHLDSNQISDISPLSSLTSLTHLCLNSNQISDVSPLSSLTNLASLWLSDNPIILPLPPLPGEGEEAIPPIEPPPPGGYPKLDSRLNQLISAEIRGEAASFAKTHNIELIHGTVVKVIIEAMPGQYEAATEAADKFGFDIVTSRRNLLSALVPIRNLAVLAAEESIRLVRMPLVPAPATGGPALPPAPTEQVNLPDLIIESVSAELAPPSTDFLGAPVMTPGTSYIFTLRIKNIGNAALSDSFFFISNTRSDSDFIENHYSSGERVNNSKQTIAPGEVLEVTITDSIDSDATQVRFMVNPWVEDYHLEVIDHNIVGSESFRIEESNYENNTSEFWPRPSTPPPSIVRRVIDETSVPVVFPDKHLELSIRTHINIPAGVIYTTDLERIEGISAVGRNITDLSGLEYCTNLTELNLVNNQISDISLLSSLTSLTRLRLIRSQISDVSPLSSLINLNHLDLSENQISDISPLLSLANLDYLFLRDNNLDFSYNSEDLEHIRQLERQGVIVNY